MYIALLADFPQEIPKIAGWYYAEWGQFIPGLTEEVLQQQLLEKSVNRNSVPLVLIARDCGSLVGVAELKFRENKHYPEYEHWLGGVFVEPVSRGKGVSDLLIANARFKAASLGVEKLYLQCEDSYIPLYEKHAFNVLHGAEHYGVSTSIMMCLL